MKCPLCGQQSATKVIDSRATDGGVRRRRECQACGERFTTYEQVQRAVVMVVKKDGRREEFQREKLLTGLRISARKRPLAAGAVEAVVEDIEQRLMASGRAEVPSRVIGEMAITHLKALDPIAYIRFASVYHQFVSLDEMLEELSRLALSPNVPSAAQARLFADEIAEMLAIDTDLDAVDPTDAPDGVSLEPEPRDAETSPAREPISIDRARTISTV